MKPLARRELAAHVRRLTGRRVLGIEFPGGKSRKSVRVAFDDGGSAIATRRKRSKRGDREVAIMRALHEHGARVPAVVAYDGTLLIQEDLGRSRLSERLHQPGANSETLMLAAIDAMAGYHRAAAKANLAEQLPVIGEEPGWLGEYVARPAEVGKALGIPAPAYDRPRAKHLLRLRKPAFVKWDSRPGNVLIGGDGQAWWFDWDRCGARNPIDDLVWLIADEFVPVDAALTRRLMEASLPEFAPDMRPDEGREYFHTIAILHAMVRFEYIMRHRAEGKWWDFDYCLATDRIGVTKECALRLLRRSTRWAGEVSGMSALSGWLGELAVFVDALD